MGSCRLPPRGCAALGDDRIGVRLRRFGTKRDLERVWYGTDILARRCRHRDDYERMDREARRKRNAKRVRAAPLARQSRRRFESACAGTIGHGASPAAPGRPRPAADPLREPFFTLARRGVPMDGPGACRDDRARRRNANTGNASAVITRTMAGPAGRLAGYTGQGRGNFACTTFIAARGTSGAAMPHDAILDGP